MDSITEINNLQLSYNQLTKFILNEYGEYKIQVRENYNAWTGLRKILFTKLKIKYIAKAHPDPFLSLFRPNTLNFRCVVCDKKINSSLYSNSLFEHIFQHIISSFELNELYQYASLKDNNYNYVFDKQNIKRNPNKPKYRVYLKPWQDPESLFCDTEFLSNFLGKEPLKMKGKCISEK